MVTGSVGIDRFKMGVDVMNSIRSIVHLYGRCFSCVCDNDRRLYERLDNCYLYVTAVRRAKPQSSLHTPWQMLLKN
jgi:hypothetical protein